MRSAAVWLGHMHRSSSSLEFGTPLWTSALPRLICVFWSHMYFDPTLPSTVGPWQASACRAPSRTLDGTCPSHSPAWIWETTPFPDRCLPPGLRG